MILNFKNVFSEKDLAALLQFGGADWQTQVIVWRDKLSYMQVFHKQVVIAFIPHSLDINGSQAMLAIACEYGVDGQLEINQLGTYIFHLKSVDFPQENLREIRKYFKAQKAALKGNK